MTRHALCLLAGTLLLSAPALAQSGPPVGPDFSKVTVKTTDLGLGTYMLEGVGGNVTVAAGGDGVIMVDGQFAPMHDKLKAAIAAVTPQPVKFLVTRIITATIPAAMCRSARTAPPSSRMRT